MDAFTIALLVLLVLLGSSLLALAVGAIISGETNTDE